MKKVIEENIRRKARRSLVEESSVKDYFLKKYIEIIDNNKRRPRISPVKFRNAFEYMMRFWQEGFFDPNGAGSTFDYDFYAELEEEVRKKIEKYDDKGWDIIKDEWIDVIIPEIIYEEVFEPIFIPKMIKTLGNFWNIDRSTAEFMLEEMYPNPIDSMDDEVWWYETKKMVPVDFVQKKMEKEYEDIFDEVIY